MWLAIVLSLCMGAGLGFYLGLRKKNTAGADIQEQLTDAQQQCVEATTLAKQLRQQVADLTYQVGEEKKARAYAESRNKPG